MLPAVCAGLLPACVAALVGTLAAAEPARARAADPPGSLDEVTIPGGLAAAMKIVDDRAVPDRGQFLLDFIRRYYDTPHAPKGDRREPVVRALLAHLESAGQRDSAAETLPLPLQPAIWNDVVFGGRPPAAGLLASIVRSRPAALFYYGLMSLDEPTRAWLSGERDLVRDLSARHPGALLAAAPGLRIAGGRLQLPGGEAAAPGWEALVGRRRDRPEDFIRALVSRAEGRVAAFFGALAMSTPAQIRAALQLDAPQDALRIEAARRLFEAFERVVPSWPVEERTFWRPAMEPLLLISELPAGADGSPVVVGTRPFWTAVFDDLHYGRPLTGSDIDPRAIATGEPIDLLSLIEQVFISDPTELRRRYRLVLFASRLLSVNRVTAETVHESLDAIRGAAAYPVVAWALERAGVTDISAYAAAARRAARLSAIADDRRAVRTITQFQGSLALLTRAAVRSVLAPDVLAGLVKSLSAIEVSDAGEYEGRLVRWVTGPLVAALPAVAETPTSEPVAMAGAIEQQLIRLLAGDRPAVPPIVEWEGTRYRIDPSWAESTRIARLLGESPVPHVSSADGMLRIAEALARIPVARDDLQRQADALERLGESLGWEGAAGARSEVVDRYREAVEALKRAAREKDVRAAVRIAASLTLLADDLLAHGLAELAYATALGEPGRALISPGEAASRHDYGMDSGGLRRLATPWRPPIAGASMRGWRVTGALLGLDVALSEFALRRVTSRPPPRKPTLNDEDRRVLMEAAVLAQPASLRGVEHEAIVAALGKGRARLAAARTAADAAAIAREIRLGPVRTTLLSWVVVRDAERLATFLSPVELFWLGLEGKGVERAFDAWGADAEPRGGCACLRMLDRRPWEAFAGRWNSGILAAGFADLNLRLAELLAELRMPAPLLAGVLPAATLELINHATSRDQDDRRGPVEFVQSLRVERLEQYLALLTTDGPLVPVGDVASSPGGGRESAPDQTTGELR